MNYALLCLLWFSVPALNGCEIALHHPPRPSPLQDSADPSITSGIPKNAEAVRTEVRRLTSEIQRLSVLLESWNKDEASESGRHDSALHSNSADPAHTKSVISEDVDARGAQLPAPPPPLSASGGAGGADAEADAWTLGLPGGVGDR
jgi:hypothetical protein